MAKTITGATTNGLFGVYYLNLFKGVVIIEIIM